MSGDLQFASNNKGDTRALPQLFQLALGVAAMGVAVMGEALACCILEMYVVSDLLDWFTEKRILREHGHEKQKPNGPSGDRAKTGRESEVLFLVCLREKVNVFTENFCITPKQACS